MRAPSRGGHEWARERVGDSLENSGKIWGTGWLMKPSFTPLKKELHSMVGKRPDRVSQASVPALALALTCSLTLGNLLTSLNPSCHICKTGILIRGVMRLNLDTAYQGPGIQEALLKLQLSCAGETRPPPSTITSPGPWSVWCMACLQ